GRGSGPLPTSKRGLEAAPPPVTSSPLTPALGTPIVAAPPPKAIPPTQPPAGPLPKAPTATTARTLGTQPPRGAAPSAAPPLVAPAAVRARPATTQGPPAPVKAASPQTGRTSAEVRALLESAKTRSQRFDLAVRHIQKKSYREAKNILGE